MKSLHPKSSQLFRKALPFKTNKKDKFSSVNPKRASRVRSAHVNKASKKSVSAHTALNTAVREQAEQIKIKNGEIKRWADKEKQAEEQIFIRTKAMDSTADGIFIIDAQKSGFPVIYANQSFQSMTGYSKREILGQTYFQIYGPEADPRIITEIKHTITQGKTFSGEMLSFRKNGEKVWNHLRITPLRDSGGIVTHYVGIQTDLTLMRQRDLELKEQREELLHVTRVGKLAEFVSSLAHEISQPLTAILSYAQAAQRLLADRELEIQKILQHIIDDDHRAAEVIRRLRSLLKKSEPEFELININELIKETIMLMSTDITVRNKVIKTQLPVNLPNVRGDRIQLQQVLLNLISNSLDAMASSPELKEIVIQTSRRGADAIKVSVRDSGCGIPEENMNKLFMHFFTSKPDGLGMGLSISRSIIEAHGGRIEAKNNPDGGATFSFTVLIAKKERPE